MEDTGVMLRFALVGIGATAIMDIWALLLWRIWKVTSLEYAFVGRWLGHMRRGVLFHKSIRTAQPIHNERAIGWASHYAIGALFAVIFGGLAGPLWLTQPEMPKALAFGALTLVFPFCVMQPAFGAGVAASKTPNPTVSRLKSVNAHLSFGLGLYLTASALKNLI